METSNEPNLDLFHPLAILRDTTQRIVHQEVPFTAARLQEYYSHFQGAFADTLEAVRKLCREKLEEAREGLDEESALAGIDQAEADLNQALEEVGSTFFAAQSFQECQDLLPHVELFESRVQTSLLELENLLAEVAVVTAFVPPPSVPEAMERVSDGMTRLERYLSEGEPKKLAEAIECLEESLTLLRTALPAE